MTIDLTLDDVSFTIEGFRDANVFESFTAYALRVLLPVFEQSPALTTFRCSISGFPIGHIDEIELGDTIRHAVATLRLTRFDDILNPPSPEAIVDGIETLIDHISTRMLFLSRPGPSLNFKMDKTAEAKVSKPRQLAILLNMLLWDAGLLREGQLSSDDILERIRRSATVADQIIANWVKIESLQDLHSALIELDAKYRIRTLRFSQKERDRLRLVRESVVLSTSELLDFVTMLIRHRDEHDVEVVLEPTRWTQEVYRADAAFNAAMRSEFSNVIQAPTQKEQKRAEAQSPAGRSKAAEKQAQMNRFAGAFASAFAAKPVETVTPSED